VKTFIFSIAAILLIFSIVVYLEQQSTGMGVRRLYLVGPNPEAVGQMCAKQVHCKSRLVPVTARAIGYDEQKKLVTCACPDGTTYKLSALTWKYAGFEG